MKSEDFIKLLDRYSMPVFTIGDAARLIGKPRGYASLYLSKMPGIRRIERGKYFVEGTSVYRIASHIVSPSYLTTTTAFAVYGLTTQIPIEVHVAATARHRPVEVEGNRITFARIGKKRFFGYIYRNGVSIATVEKSIIDALFLGVGFGEVIDAASKALKMRKLSVQKLEEFTIMFGSKALASKIGFILEFCGAESSALVRYRSKNPVMLSAGAEHYDKKWHVLYDERLLSKEVLA